MPPLYCLFALQELDANNTNLVPSIFLFICFDPEVFLPTTNISEIIDRDFRGLS